MNDLSNIDIPKIKIWNDQRVVTFNDIDKVHQRPKGTASRNFKSNRKHFIKDVDYFLITRDIFNGRNPSINEKLNIETIPPKGITLFTETGYLMLVKSFQDDLSWKVQRILVSSYFNCRKLQNEVINRSDVPQPNEGHYPSLANTWMKDHEPLFKQICSAYGISRKELYHKILLDIGDDYNVDDYRVFYKRDTGHAPEYIMEVVSFYPELRESAETIIQIHMNRVRSYPKEYLEQIYNR